MKRGEKMIPRQINTISPGKVDQHFDIVDIQQTRIIHDQIFPPSVTGACIRSAGIYCYLGISI